MKTNVLMRLGAVILVMIASLPPLSDARADAAPPGQPSGSNIDPGVTTNVRMVREVVIISVLKTYPDYSQGQISVDASFSMRNLGNVEEQLNVRFPLSNANGEGDGYGGMPEITDLKVKVNGSLVGTSRLTTPNPSGFIDTPVPWAVFPVTFPVGKDVSIEVIYTAEGTAYEYEPNVRFGYILETGAGWYDTIGSGDFYLRLPYEANEMNVATEGSGFSFGTVVPEFDGQEVHWHLENFEPNSQYNLAIDIVKVDLWLRVLIEETNVSNNPNDGEAWGRLGNNYFNVINYFRWLREDAAGLEMYQKALDAYDKAVTIKPNDAMWHFRYANAWFQGYTSYYGYPEEKAVEHRDMLLQAVQELSRSLQLDPENQLALDLANQIASMYPDWVQTTENGYDFLALTATPIPSLAPAPTSTSQPVPLPSVTLTRVSTSVPTSSVLPSETSALPPSPAPTESASPSGCAAALLPAIFILLWMRRHLVRA